jgi:hypothetical protein
MEITYIYELSKNGIPFYIGKTKNLKSREKDHKKFYGEDIIMTEIDSVNSFKKEDWKPLETFWITQYKFFGFDLNNVRSGGGGKWATIIDRKAYMKEYMTNYFPRYYQENKSKFKEQSQNWFKTEKGKEYQREYNKTYSKTDKAKEYRQEYSKTEKSQKYRQEYSKSEKNKEYRKSRYQMLKNNKI